MLLQLADTAGNSGAPLTGEVPAACEGALAVTALDAEGTLPAAWSNYLPLPSSGGAQQRVLAAPGAFPFVQEVEMLINSWQVMCDVVFHVILR